MSSHDPNPNPDANPQSHPQAAPASDPYATQTWSSDTWDTSYQPVQPPAPDPSAPVPHQQQHPQHQQPEAYPADPAWPQAGVPAQGTGWTPAPAVPAAQDDWSYGSGHQQPRHQPHPQGAGSHGGQHAAWPAAPGQADQTGHADQVGHSDHTGHARHAGRPDHTGQAGPAHHTGQARHAAHADHAAHAGHAGHMGHTGHGGGEGAELYRQPSADAGAGQEAYAYAPQQQWAAEPAPEPRQEAAVMEPGLEAEAEAEAGAGTGTGTGAEAGAAAGAAAGGAPAYSTPTLMGNTRIRDPKQARAEGRSPIIDPGPQSALLTAALGLLIAVAAPVGELVLLGPLVLLQALTAAGWFRLNGMWPARQGIVLAFAGALVADAAVLAVSEEHAAGAVVGTLGVWVVLTLVLQLRSHASPDERVYGLMASVASAAFAIICTGYLAAGHAAVTVGAAAVAVAAVARALPLPQVASVVAALGAATGAGIAVGGFTDLGAGGALLGLVAGACALVGLRVAAYDYPSKFVHMTAGVALPLAVAAPAVALIGRVVG